MAFSLSLTISRLVGLNLQSGKLSSFGGNSAKNSCLKASNAEILSRGSSCRNPLAIVSESGTVVSFGKAALSFCAWYCKLLTIIRRKKGYREEKKETGKGREEKKMRENEK